MKTVNNITNNRIYICFTILSLAVALTGCGRGSDVITSPIQGIGGFSPDTTVCNPFTNDIGVNPGSNHGLWGKLSTTPVGQTPFTTVEAYQTSGSVLPYNLFLSQLNIFTRPFDTGFPTQSNSFITDSNGEKLIEYFGLHLEGRIGLGTNDQPGSYIFATLSDDGVNLSINDGHYLGYSNNTPTRMSCSTEMKTLSSATDRLSMKLDYFQGPRMHIALVMLWKFIPSGQTASLDQECGNSGNDRFFTWSGTESVPTQNFQGLLSRGWKVLTSENYFLPEHIPANPCN